MKSLASEITFFNSLVEQDDVVKESVSKWSTHKQIEHTLITNKKILQLILSPEKWDASGKPKTLLGYFVLTLGIMPRGKAKAPKVVLPQGEDLKALLSETKELIEKTLSKLKNKPIRKESIQEHPYFGSLTIKDWLRMLEIHQRHHIKIIKEIF